MRQRAVLVRRSAAVVVVLLFASPALAQGQGGQQPPKAVALQAAAGDRAQPSKEEALRAVAGPLAGAPAAGISACSLCYSCGGAWPVFSGVVPTRAGASPWERGAGCSGSLTPTSDTGPYLCCRP
jgi:hypothetical protein